MSRTARAVLVALLTALAIGLLAIIVLSAGKAPVSLPLPNPNGYDDFLKATTLLRGDVYSVSALDHDGLQAFVSTNGEALRLIRQGLARGCSVPTDSASTNISQTLGDLAKLKPLARLLAEEGRLAEIEGRYAAAAQSYLETIRFGNEMSRGGFIIIRLVGIACEAIGEVPLRTLVAKLKPEEAQAVIHELEQIDRTSVTWDEVVRNEKRFARLQPGHGFNPITWAVAQWQTWRVRQRAEMRQNRLAAHLRLLTAELAVRSYQAERGVPPTDLAQLVPKYLQRIPSDPFSGRSMIYRRQGTQWLLYSVGEDGVDDGGKPVARPGAAAGAKGDIFYNSPY